MTTFHICRYICISPSKYDRKWSARSSVSTFLKAKYKLKYVHSDQYTNRRPPTYRTNKEKDLAGQIRLVDNSWFSFWLSWRNVDTSEKGWPCWILGFIITPFYIYIYEHIYMYISYSIFVLNNILSGSCCQRTGRWRGRWRGASCPSWSTWPGSNRTYHNKYK